MVRLTGVGKRYGRGRAVLRDVHLDLPPGEVIAITGGNGSGKSTLLRILVGASRPSQGTVTGRPRAIGYVPERFPSSERLSARSYLSHMGRLRGLSSGAAEAGAEHWLTRLALAGGPDTALRQLSKGNLQKVGLAQALLVMPELLVLDEPWSGLDASAHGVLAEVIAEVAGANGTVVFTDHRAAVVRSTATRRYRIVNGQLEVVTEETESALVTRLVLTAPADAAADDVLANALSVRREGGRVVVRVAPAEADQLLLTALRGGWSVVRVDEPAAG